MIRFPTMSKKSVAAAGAAGATVLALAATVIMPYEGFFPKTYKDIVGVPTVCYGETEAEAVALGRKRPYTKQECADMLAKSLIKYDEGMMKCLKKPITEDMRVAFISVTYNIGIGGFCRSGMARQVNAGNPRAACDALLAWNRAGGRVVRGLTLRRQGERVRCLKGL